MKKKSPPLTFDQYRRIFNIADSLAPYFAPPVGRACLFYNLTGAALMQAHYNKDAKLFCGLGAVALSKKSSAGEMAMLSWFQVSEGIATATEEAFHAWVEFDDWIIDFTAPNYREAFAAVPFERKIPPPLTPRKMLQKPRHEVSGDIDDLANAGDAVFDGNPGLTVAIIDRIGANPQMGDVLNIATKWHRPFPRRIAPLMMVGSNDGKQLDMKFVERSLDGVW